MQEIRFSAFPHALRAEAWLCRGNRQFRARRPRDQRVQQGSCIFLCKKTFLAVLASSVCVTDQGKPCGLPECSQPWHHRRIPAVRHRKTAGVASRHGFSRKSCTASPVYQSTWVRPSSKRLSRWSLRRSNELRCTPPMTLDRLLSAQPRALGK